MAKELIVYGRPPSSDTHQKYSKIYKAFMGATLTKVAKQHGVFKSLSHNINNQTAGHCYLLRTGKISSDNKPVMQIALGSGKIGTCVPSNAMAGARVEFNLRFDPNSEIIKNYTILKQTALMSDDEKRHNAELKKTELEKMKKQISKQEYNLRKFEKQISEAMEIEEPTNQEAKFIQNMLLQKAKMIFKLKVKQRNFEIAKRQFYFQRYSSYFTDEAPIITFGNKPCIWLNESEVRNKKDKTMLCWSLEILDAATPIDPLNSHCNYGLAKETQKQFENLLIKDCSKEELELLVPVKLTSLDNYQSATPILDKKIEIE